jgi:hypothetical protein
VTYKAPPANVPWSQLRRLQANPKPGFQTGFDLSDPAEKVKQEARQKRFGIVAAPPTDDTTLQETTEENLLPILQAWDNESLVGMHRTDPPQSLWKNLPLDTTEVTEQVDEFREETAKPPTLVHEKIHIFSIDWAAFKQIRTNDIMAYFSIYGPTYVEWLDDLSANVIFEGFSAARALENMSQELPTPPPEEDLIHFFPSPPDFGGMGWRFGRKLLHKVTSDRYGQRGTTARLLMRVATSLDILQDRPSSWPKPPPGFSTKRVLGPGSDFPKQNKRTRGGERSDPGPPGTEQLMNSSLSAGRAGFSVEEMEAERARKRAKESTNKPQGTDESA